MTRPMSHPMPQSQSASVPEAHPGTQPETRIVSSRKVVCDGGEGALGHPRVYLQIPAEPGWVDCPYCDCRYIHEDAARTPE